MKNVMCEGWSVTDNSTKVTGDDSTVVTEWVLEKGLIRHTIGEVFGDWAINGLFVTCTRSDIDRALIAGGLPTLSSIEEALNPLENSA